MSINLKKLKLLLLFAAILAFGSGYAQQKTITGKVTDASNGEPLPGVSIVVKGTTTGTITNMGGEYSLNVSVGQTLAFSYIGYTPQEVVIDARNVINIQLKQSVEALEEVVVIGYGQVRKDDATGSVQAVKATDFNRGAITSPQQLVTGKIAGVQIISGGGAPDQGSTIRIRGGSSLSASNDPLIVIDGVPVDNTGISGMGNPLNTIHPNDIESFTVLKDASATAIYGSRASNGVIIITTKKGQAGKPLNFNYTGYMALGDKSGSIDVLSAVEFRNLIKLRYAGNPNVTNLLGTANTFWQDEIYRTSLSHDHNFSVTGNVKKIPFRASVGYTNNQGILLTSEMNRVTGSLGFSPNLLDNHLRIDANLKGMYVRDQWANQGAIGTAVSFDPSQPVKNGSKYGGYFTWLQPNGDPIALAAVNPVAQLMLTDDHSSVWRYLGNAQIDYKLHFLPDLKATLNLGMDISNSHGNVTRPEYYPSEYNATRGGGTYNDYTQDKKNMLLDFYLNYAKGIKSIDSRFDIMAGYSWQHLYRKGTSLNQNFRRSYTYSDTDYESENFLVSFFGRFNYIFKERYLLTFTLREDGSSRFSPDTRWGTFPSAALAWQISDEPFLKNANLISNLKLRLGYGITGQQNITSNDYPYLPIYVKSEETASYQFGNTFTLTYRPDGYDANIKWEETTTYNIGLDYGFLKDRINGTVDVYKRVTKDLINFIPVPAGTNLTNMILTNVGSLENRGVEFAINVIPVLKNNLTWEVGFNATYNKNEITKLTLTDDPKYLGVNVGGISGAVGNTIQIHSVGYPANSFFVFEQVYNSRGYPVEGLSVDRNGDGTITNDDRYRLKKAAPDVFMGLSSRLNWKNWDFSFTGRISIGNYIYNNVWSSQATYSNLYVSSGFLNNLHRSVYETSFENPKYFSDFYIQNASFIKMDNISLGYTFKKVFGDKLNLRAFSSVQNLFVITGYKGLDPEISGGIDNNFYPRPVTYQLGVSIDY